MYSTFELSFKYLRYLATASNGKGHGTHSPFVYDFITKVLNDRTRYPEYDKIESTRQKLLQDQTPVPLEDYGAGSALQGRDTAATKSIGNIVRDSSKNARYGQLLSRMVKYYRPQYIVELGTAAGMSTAYLASADPSATVYTAEGNYALAGVARQNLRSLGLGHVEIITGNFNNTLPQILGSVPHIDFAFIDGNHRETPTVQYFEAMLPKISEEAILVFDDIHWSAGMESAWNQIKSHSRVLMTVDLFFMGIVFFRREFKVKQHFVIRF